VSVPYDQPDRYSFRPPHKPQSWDVLQVAEDVIAAVKAKDLPADEVLRGFFKERARLGVRLPSAEVTRAVFDYYRWRGWTRPDNSMAYALHKTTELAKEFEADPEAFSDEELIKRALPAWVGGEVEITGALVRALQAQPKLWLRARKGQGTETVQRLGVCKPLGPGPLSETLEYCGAQDIFRTESFLSGAIQIQDASSQAVGLLCNPAAGQTWWDACAGEGGKTLHLSDLMGNKGLIWVSDRAQWRLRRLRVRAARSNVFNYRSALWDGGAKLPTRTWFDGVLVDAPCSGIGTWGRNPHARWTTSLKDVHELAAVQAGLLANACAAVKPGGRLIYSVCTLARSETEAVAEVFEKAHADFKPLGLPDVFKPNAAPRERRWFLPQDHGANGMFVAAWVRE